MVTNETLELIPEGLLSETDPAHTCPRCREVARTVSHGRFVGAMVALSCANGHTWTASIFELPVPIGI